MELGNGSIKNMPGNESNNNPIVSVIIPCYNSSNKMTNCLNSLKEQTYKNIEIIFVDDCSDSDTKNILYDFALNSGVKTTIIRNATNLGPSLSRQVGIKKSSGTYIAFIDSDDYVDKTFVEEMVRSILLENSDISFCDYFFVSKSKKMYKRKRYSSLLLRRIQDKVVANVDSLWGLLFDRKLFEDIRFPDIRNGEDMAIIPQLFLKAGTISHVDKYLYFYVYYPNSLSNDTKNRAIHSLKESTLCVEKSLGNLYPQEVEFLAVRNYLYASILILVKSGCKKSDLAAFLDEFQAKYPNWYENSYLKSLSKYKRMILFFYKKHLFLSLKAVCHIRGLLLNN